MSHTSNYIFALSNPQSDDNDKDDNDKKRY